MSKISQAWAGKMKTLLEQMNAAVHDAGGALEKDQADQGTTKDI
jgi:hypothetical protein